MRWTKITTTARRVGSLPTRDAERLGVHVRHDGLTAPGTFEVQVNGAVVVSKTLPIGDGAVWLELDVFAPDYDFAAYTSSGTGRIQIEAFPRGAQ